MNTLVKHPILQHLPSELLKNPERNTLQAFLKKKIHTFYRLKIAMIIAFVIYLVLLYVFETVHTTVRDLAMFDSVFNLLPLAIFLGLAITFHNRRKRFAIPENEIDAAIEELRSQHVPA